MNIVIVAGGLGTRFRDLSIFPKVLLPTNKFNSILEEDLSITGDDDKVYLVINQKYYDMTLNYLKVNHLFDKLTLISTSNTNGSYNSIKSVIGQLPSEDVLFIWSDLVLDKIPTFNHNSDCIIFTYENQGYRYRYDEDGIRLVYDYSGNVPGVYYIKNLNDVFTFGLDSFNNFDLIDALNGSKINLSGQALDTLFEYRDYDIYVKNVKNITQTSLKTRFFNRMSIEDNGNTLKKEAIDPNYYSIIEKEFNWYKFGYNNICRFDKLTPFVQLDSFIDNSFKMEYLKDYLPLHRVIKDITNPGNVEKIYSNIKNCIEILEENSIEVEKDDFAQDLKKEIIDKVIDRCDKIKDMLINYNKPYLINVLNKVYDYLISLENGTKVRYYFGHGDLNGSNVLVNPNTFEVKFVDPRGYFGYTNKYIWKDYEYAKLLYCLSGYDDFNNLPQIYGVDEPQRLGWYTQIDYLNKQKYRVLVGIIYVALAGYISQDIMKANISYEYGLKLLHEEGF